eukprot:66337-Prorocentrum_minimum.AAC.2
MCIRDSACSSRACSSVMNPTAAMRPSTSLRDFHACRVQVAGRGTNQRAESPAAAQSESSDRHNYTYTL